MVTAKGERRRAALVAAATELVLAGAPVSHRAVAEAAGSSLSATTYYFADLDAILAAAGARIAAGWVERAERVADGVVAERDGDARPAREGHVVEALLDAILPADGEIAGHYAHLVAAASMPALARAYAEHRPAIDAAVTRILGAGAVSLDADVAVAVVDGAVISALSEGSDPRTRARELVRRELRR
ncbi:putative regulator [Beutenbergia cavernae DSM 12333]|uniref:Putative regulator n=1 Tax=Beutenbergia cavernae (strain ATCC BAA-8 / DSM 12333 / CCUG 43141 / JCM 11478 / NBRC 16432 / NCIMB 13614 / HKI 0122) TaxID=471853 RepID=C5C175_BEUC1|nr:hypothetical protein [Beutenbergia cavernae]ACQ81485.1 putative regulator [Beutenbergia cavernae DSM 12333]